MIKKSLFTILFLTGCFISNAQWSNNPSENNLITPPNADIYDFSMKVTNNGTAFVAYNRPTGGSIATFLQIVDTYGNMLFSNEGKKISQYPTRTWTSVDELLFVDRDGNAIITVIDRRHSNSEEEESYTLYKVSPTGEMLWGVNGIDISSGETFLLSACFNMVQIEDGSYVCAWINVDWNDKSYIQMQRISTSGELLWDATETRLYSNSFSYQYPFLVNAGNNQVILVFVRGSGDHLVARKIDFDFSPVWAEDLNIYQGGFTIPPLWVVIRVISDSAGGAFVGWYDDRFFTNKETTHVAHIQSNGTHGFGAGEGGIPVNTNEFLRSFAPQLYFNTNEKALYVAFRETSSQQSWQQMTGQKIDVSTGELLWGDWGIEISPLTEHHSISFYSVESAGNDNLAVFFTSTTWDPEYLWGKDVNNAMLLNNKGEHQWKDSIIVFADVPFWKSRMVSTPLISNNYWITGWKDERKTELDPSGVSKIYLQRINIDGTLGDNTTTCFPPTNLTVSSITEKSAMISWTVDADKFELAYREFGHDWDYVEVSENNSFLLDNLIAETRYQVMVRTICSEDDVSDWTVIKDFTTKPLEICNVAQKFITVYSVDKRINISNPERKYIENVKLFDISGKTIFDYSVCNNHSVTIPYTINEQIVIVKIIFENDFQTYKISIK